MDPVSIFCILLGVLIIATRAPLIFAPSATLAFFGRLLSTDARIRGFGVVIAALALPLIVLPLGEGSGAGMLHALGWLWAAATLWLLSAPGSYGRLARRVLEYFESSVDDAIVRIVGLVAVAIGGALVYVGVYVV